MCRRAHRLVNTRSAGSANRGEIMLRVVTKGRS